MIRSYEDLIVYQRSYQLALAMYEKSRKIPKDETYGIISQLKRASLSIPLNIAEGYGKRSSVNEFKRFLSMAIGSCDEMKVLIDFCKDLGFIEVSEHEHLKGAYNEVGRMLNGLSKKWVKEEV